jgi:hypothetical protein
MVAKKMRRSAARASVRDKIQRAQLTGATKEYDPSRYNQFTRKASRILYWLVLLTLTIANFLLFVVLLPLFSLLFYGHLLVIISVVGLLFGLIFNFLIQDVEHLQPKHHAFAAVFIPAISILNISILLSIMQQVQQVYGILENQITTASLLYVVFFAAPYALSWLRGTLRSQLQRAASGE